MKYLTKRQRKRKKVQLFKRIGFFQTDSESEPTIDLDMESDLEADDGPELLLDNKKVPMKSISMQMPLSTKVIDNSGIRYKHPQQQQQQQHEGTATTFENRRYNFGFGSYNLPPIDRDLECYYHRNVPLTLGNFMDLERLRERPGQRSKSTSTPKTSPAASNASERPVEPSMYSSSNESESSKYAESNDKEQEDRKSRAFNEPLKELLTRVASSMPYEELTSLPFTMLKDTAFGAFDIGTASTSGNMPRIMFWPAPFQLNILEKEELNAEDTQHIERVNARPEYYVKPIGFESRCRNLNDEQHERSSVAQAQDMWLPWQDQSQTGSNNNTFEQNMNILEPHAMSIVDGIKCIWKRNMHWNNSDVSFINWGSGQTDSIWKVADEQKQQSPAAETSWDQRNRALANPPRLYGNYATMTLPETMAALEYQQQGKKLSTAPTATATSNGGNYYASKGNPNSKPLYYYNRNVDCYNTRLANSRMQHQQQQFLEQQQQLQSVRYYYPNQQQQQQQQHYWQWQQYRQPKPRPHFNVVRYYKNNYYNNNSNNNNNNHAFHKFCKFCNTNLSLNSNNNICNNNMDQLLLNMSQDDLDATQMYAIHGERFFEMPLGRRYNRSLYPLTATILPPPPPIPVPGPPPLAIPPKISPPKFYLANVHFNNWQANFMPQYPTPVETAPPTLPAQVPASNCVDFNHYTANFPPLPAPNQRRVGQSQKD